MFDDLKTTLSTILAVLGAATIAVGGVSALIKLFSPFKRLKERVEKHDKLFDASDQQLDECKLKLIGLEAACRAFAKAHLAILDHEITNGNSIDELKEAKDIIQNYIINK